MSAPPPEVVAAGDAKVWAKKACGAFSAALPIELPVIPPLGPDGLERTNLGESTISALWKNGSTVTYGFLQPLTADSPRRKAIAEATAEWSKYANLKFVYTEPAANAMIRISFDPAKGSWTYIGTEILQVTDPAQPTMNLGGIPEDVNLTPTDKGVILHEFGHAIGLRHEHRSSKPGGVTVHAGVLGLYFTGLLGWTEDRVLSLATTLNQGDVSNYSRLDTTSIMSYFMPKEMNLEGIAIAPNIALDTLDKAYAICYYPPDVTNNPSKQLGLAWAMTVAGVPSGMQQKYLALTWSLGDSFPAQFRMSFNQWARDVDQSTSVVVIPAQPPSPNPPQTTPSVPSGDTSWFKYACGGFRHLKPTESAAALVGFQYTPPSSTTLVTSILWAPSYTITWSFLKPLAVDSPRRKAVENAIAEWTKYVAIYFVYTDDPSDAILRISFDPIGGSWSYLGQEMLEVEDRSLPTMNLGRLSNDNAVSTADYGVVLHQFGHALGFRHEFQSANTSGVILDCNAVSSYLKVARGWGSATVTDEILNLHADYEISNYIKYDERSIMNYFMPKEFNLSRIELSPLSSLSDLDKAYATIYYPQPVLDNPVFENNLWKALQTVGVPEDVNTNIRQGVRQWADPQITAPRLDFTSWNEKQVPLPPTSGGGDEDPPSTIDVEDPGQSPAWFQKACAAAPMPDDDLDDLSTQAGLEDGSFEGAVLTKSANLWNNGETITYGFLTPLASTSRRRIAVENATKEWAKWANLKFEYKSDPKQAKVRISFDANSGSWSYVGKGDISKITDKTKATMNLGWLKETVATSESDFGVVLHEWGHALGLLHEHQSPARGGSLHLDEAAVILYYGRTQKWTEAKVRAQIINVFSKDNVSNYSAWDQYSIMQYYMPKEMNLERIEIAPNKVLDALDKAYIMCNYPPNIVANPAKERDLINAMSTAGVPSSTQQTIIDSFECDAGGSLARQHFIVWNIAASARTNPAPAGDLNPEDGLDPEDPAEGANDQPEQPSDQQSEPFLTTLISKLSEFFKPGGGQIFTLQFPGRFLAQSQYAWDTKSAGIYGPLVKPTIVNESEFRLVDQLYDVAEVVSAPNGSNLSIVYEQMLNNLLPKYQDTGLAKQQAKIRAWLLKDAKVSSWMRTLIKAQADAAAQKVGQPTGDDTDPSNALAPPAFDILDKTEDTINRLELSNALMQDYLEAKQKWELERDAMLEESLKYKLGTPESDTKLNSLTRKLAHITAIREAQLAGKYADAVAQGFYHNVRQYMGYLNIKTASEFLEDAKDSFREAAMSSMDGALKVYPVQLSPIDWFEGLSTSFTVEDLTSDPDLIAQVIDMKSKELDNLNADLIQLQLGGKGDPKQYEKAVADAQTKLEDTGAALASAYSNNVISMAKTCIDAYGKVQESRLQGVANTLGIVGSAALGTLKKGLEDVAKAQLDLNAASRALSDVLAGRALAEATDTQMQQEQIRIRQGSLKRELNELTTRYAAINKSASGPQLAPQTGKIGDIELLPRTNNTSGGSRWQEITMTSQVTSSESKSASASAASAENWHVNLWLGSAGGSSSSSAAWAKDESIDTEQKVELGFRATLVTVDRAGWFQPQFFKQSAAYYHVNKDLKFSQYPTDPKITTPEDLKLNPNVNYPIANRGLLPGYPVGYVICKDITIKVSNAKKSSASGSQFWSQQANAAGGILCFSYSKSSSSSGSEKSFSYQACSDGFVIRIPGPQILGYIIQLTEKDLTVDLPAQIPDNFWIPEDTDDAAQGVNNPAQGISGPSDDAGGPADAPGRPDYSKDFSDCMGTAAGMLQDLIDRIASVTPTYPITFGQFITQIARANREIVRATDCLTSAIDGLSVYPRQLGTQDRGALGTRLNDLARDVNALLRASDPNRSGENIPQHELGAFSLSVENLLGDVATTDTYGSEKLKNLYNSQ